MARKRASAPQAASVSSAAAVEAPARDPAVVAAELLAELKQDLVGCDRCRLCEQRKTIVVGEGDARARLMFIGEAPGETEDQLGRPFVGKAGELLDKMIAAMGLRREQVYIANVVKCRPPANRNPEEDEIAACAPYLARQIAAVNPEIIVALGKHAASALLRRPVAITSERGRIVEVDGRPVMPTFHPAYLLRNPEGKKDVWFDLKQVAARLGLTLPGGGRG